VSTVAASCAPADLRSGKRKEWHLYAVGSRGAARRYLPVAHGPEERFLGGARRQCRRHELRPAVLAAGDLYRQARRRDAASMPRYGDRRRIACRENRRRTARHLGADEYGAARAPT
jgi:hypothetical protein